MDELSRAFNRVCDEEAGAIIPWGVRITPIEITLDADHAKARGYTTGRILRVNGTHYEIAAVEVLPLAGKSRLTLDRLDEDVLEALGVAINRGANG